MLDSGLFASGLVRRRRSGVVDALTLSDVMNARAQTRSMVLRFSTGAQTKDALRDECECAISCTSETRFGFMQNIIGDGAPYIRPNSGRGFPLTRKCLRDPTQRHMMRVGPNERPCRILARMRGDFCSLALHPAGLTQA